MRPLHPQELKPYLQRGMEKLAAALQKQQKTAGELQLEACSAQGLLFKKTASLKRLQMMLRVSCGRWKACCQKNP